MDTKRAKEICASSVMANVTHDGVPVYIESVHDNATACIHPLGRPADRQTVELSSLTER